MVFDEQTLAVCHQAAGADGETSSGGSSNWDSDHLLTKHCTVHKHTCVVYKKEDECCSTVRICCLICVMLCGRNKPVIDPPCQKKTLKLYLHPFPLFSHLNHQEPLKTASDWRLWRRISVGSISRIVRFWGVFWVFFSPRQLNFVFWLRKVHKV